MKNKKIIFVTILIIILISIFTYKFLKSGNTIINKSEEDIVNNILNMKLYKAKIEIEVQTNKNKNKYIVKQSLEENNVSTQEVMEPNNIAGVVTKYDGNNLKIINNNLNLTKTYENYNYIVENNLWLNTFIEEYKKYSNTKITNKNNEIILELKDENGNKYSIFKQLYIDKNTQKPTKMVIKDINKKTLVYISYNEIEIS